MLPLVRLRAIEKDDLKLLRDWRNAVIANMREYRLLNMEHQQRWWEEHSAQAYERYPRHLMYMCERIIGANQPLPIGVGGWTYIDWLNRRAELSIYIGDEKLRGRGYGRAFLRQLHRIAFEELGLVAVWLEVHDWNEAARKLYETEGYTYIGQWRNARYRDGGWYPTHIYDFTADDYYKLKAERAEADEGNGEAKVVEYTATPVEPVAAFEAQYKLGGDDDRPTVA